MKIGLHIASTSWQGDSREFHGTLRNVVQTAEAAGFDLISVVDHLWQHPIMGGPETNQIESYTTLGFMAALTNRVRLTTLVTAASYRPAGLLAKMVTTLDVLTGGRMMLGIGAGDNADEAAGLGLPYPSLATRFAILEETVQACLQMWDGTQGNGQPLHGEHVHLGRALNLPQAITRPHPPIMIAGGGERRTLPLVAKYADACNIPPSPEIPHKLELLRRLCDEQGRDYDAIEKTAPFGFDVGERGEKVPEILEQLRWLAGMGVETVIGWVVDVERIAPLEIMGREVIPAAAEFQANAG